MTDACWETSGFDRDVAIETPASVTSADLKKVRKSIGETQAEFGRRFGVIQTTIHRWETNGIPDRGPARMAIERVLADIVVSEQVPA